MTVTDFLIQYDLNLSKVQIKTCYIEKGSIKGGWKKLEEYFGHDQGGHNESNCVKMDLIEQTDDFYIFEHVFSGESIKTLILIKKS